MDENLKTFLKVLAQKKYIGGRHTPEHKLIKLITEGLKKEEIKEFDKAYKQIVNGGFIIRLKKRTGKGSDWHISLNPSKLKELLDILEIDEEASYHGGNWNFL